MKYFIINLLLLFSITYVYADEDFLYKHGYKFMINEKIDIDDIILVEWGKMGDHDMCWVTYQGKSGGEEFDGALISKLECELLDSIVKNYKLKNPVKK